MKQRSKNFKQKIDLALKDQKLQDALHTFGDAYVVSRANAFAGYDFEAMRGEISAMKTYVRENHKELMAEFIKNAEAAGSIVYLAKDAEDANRYIANLAKKRGVKNVVKSKSMVSEETHLNKALIAEGITPLETDLGEWILQLADHRPSHMVMPAIHMFRDEVGELFAKASGEPATDDIIELVRIARRRLREGYFDAQMGISGANVLIAETGGIALVTNEGNARLVTTIPDIHVVLSGIEKIVPKIEDAAKVLRILPKNATSQPMTSYGTWIRGTVPNRDSKKEQHIVLIDNGRSEMAKDKHCQDALNCIRCGACANVCPVYQSVGGHVFGSIYISAIGVILTAYYEGLDKAAELVKACIGCRSCSAVCPSGIDLESIILHLRSKVADKEGIGVIKDVAFKKIMKNRRLFHSMVRAASLLQKPVTHGEKTIRHLPMFFSNLTEWRTLPTIAEKPFRDLFPKIEQKRSKHVGKITFFAGCGTDFIYPELGTSLIKVLNHLGVEVMFPDGQNCCGVPALYSGDKETTKEMAKQNVDCLLEGNPDYILTVCPTCTMALRKDFLEVLEDEPAYINKAKRISEKVMDVSAYITDVLKAQEAFQELNIGGTITYHDSCHLKRGSGVSEQPRTLLQTAGKKIIEMEHPDRCCGFGGSYSFLSHPEISKRITGSKAEEIEQTGADMVAMDCPGCKIMLSGAMEKRGGQVQAKHTIEILAEALDD